MVKKAEQKKKKRPHTAHGVFAPGHTLCKLVVIPLCLMTLVKSCETPELTMLYGLRHGGWVSMQIKKWAQTAKVVFASGHTLCQSSSYSLMFDDIGQKL